MEILGYAAIVAICICGVIAYKHLSAKTSEGHLDEPESGSEKTVAFRKWDKGSHGDHWSAVLCLQTPFPPIEAGFFSFTIIP